MSVLAKGRAVGVGGLVLAAIVAAGFTLQAAFLPRPTRSELIVSGVIDRLLGFQVVRARQVLAGRRTTSVCWQTTAAAGRKHLPQPAEVVRLGAQTLVDRGFRLRGPGPPAVRLAAFELAGCPHPIAAWIGGWLDRRRPIRVASASVDGVPTFVLRVGKPWRRLVLVVARRSLVPLALRVTIGHTSGSSVIIFAGSASPSAEALAPLRRQHA